MSDSTITYSVYYMNPDYFKEGIMGYDWCKKHRMLPNISNLKATHTFLKVVHALNLEDLYWQMQAENWSPKGEASELIKSKGLSHTSMSVGDIAIDSGGNFYMVDRLGFKRLG